MIIFVVISMLLRLLLLLLILYQRLFIFYCDHYLLHHHEYQYFCQYHYRQSKQHYWCNLQNHQSNCHLSIVNFFFLLDSIVMLWLLLWSLLSTLSPLLSFVATTAIKKYLQNGVFSQLPFLLCLPISNPILCYNKMNTLLSKVKSN